MSSFLTEFSFHVLRAVLQSIQHFLFLTLSYVLHLDFQLHSASCTSSSDQCILLFFLHLLAVLSFSNSMISYLSISSIQSILTFTFMIHFLLFVCFCAPSSYYCLRQFLHVFLRFSYALNPQLHSLSDITSFLLNLLRCLHFPRRSIVRLSNSFPFLCFSTRISPTTILDPLLPLVTGK